jgi:DNA mismatch endonuclease, patch repair protein
MRTTFKRDKRSPEASSAVASKVMSANKAKNTKPEISLRKLLSASGIRGYRLNYKKAPGSPDIAFPKAKIAIFVNGCYWHRCPHCNLPLPKSNTEFWLGKFKKNQERDIRKIELLKEEKWNTHVIWEYSRNMGV